MSRTKRDNISDLRYFVSSNSSIVLQCEGNREDLGVEAVVTHISIRRYSNNKRHTWSRQRSPGR
jgi:hypothetical protein